MKKLILAVVDVPETTVSVDIPFPALADAKPETLTVPLVPVTDRDNLQTVFTKSVAGLDQNLNVVDPTPAPTTPPTSTPAA